MEDNNQSAESTEVVVQREPATLSIRETLKQQLNSDRQEEKEEVSKQETSGEVEQSTPVEQQAPQAERPLLVPPSDMNASEKEAFLNPSAQNAHVLQQYLNRRAYETRMQYDRKMQEVNQLHKHNQSVYDVIKQYEDDYAKEGISVSDIARRSIAWDRAMKNDPIGTAMEWLQSYGVDINQLLDQPAQQYEQPTNYLTREEAERIAAEKYESIAQEQEKKALELYNQRVVELFMNGKPLFKDPETASQLEAEMAPVVQALNATGRYSSAEEVLETAYNYVVNGNPTFSGIMQKMTTGPVIQQQQAVAQKAKQAAKSISGSAGSGTPRVHAQTFRDNLKRRFHGE
jgi:hypothetical protein